MNPSPNQPALPLLLVPGALNGGWIWQGNFLEYFQAAGFAVRTVTFPSHNTTGLKRQRLRLGDFVQHLGAEIDRCERPPVVIAHSLGGLVTLLAARQKPIAAAALLSPIPPDGVLRSMVALGRRSPVSLLKMLMVAADARIARYGAPPLGIYSETCDPALAATTTQKLRGESLLALAQTLVRRGGSAPPNTPLHFFGAEGDYIIPAAEVRRSARLFNAPITIYPGMSHSFQVERDWAVMAGDIRDWLAGL